mmetsp:Transcript_63955/g.198013  ORF Transcript_63955/g.198013 Transcript_63955/m.198013 type:complete len:206 (-) Transcript_63955:39-656(-)
MHARVEDWLNPQSHGALADLLGHTRLLRRALLQVEPGLEVISRPRPTVVHLGQSEKVVIGLHGAAARATTCKKTAILGVVLKEMPVKLLALRVVKACCPNETAKPWKATLEHAGCAAKGADAYSDGNSIVQKTADASVHQATAAPWKAATEYFVRESSSLPTREQTPCPLVPLLGSLSRQRCRGGVPRGHLNVAHGSKDAEQQMA